MRKTIRKLAKKILPCTVRHLLARAWSFPRGVPWRIFNGIRARRILRYLEETRGRPSILLIGTPEHGNIGDHAIVIAMREFFKKYFPERCVVEVVETVFSIAEKQFRRFYESGQAEHLSLTIIGGGSLGNLWLSAERAYRRILATFPRKRVVVFPQTIFFEENATRERELEATRAAYRAHADLHIFIRDKSIDFMRREIVGGNFSDVRGVPDIVLSLDRSAPKFERAGVLLCFRADKEKTLPDTAVAAIEVRLRERGESIVRTDTVVPYGVPAELREFETERKFDEFRRARLVITDRLHGMIFAAITGTPCIALNNSSGKVEGVWSLWLQHLDYVKFVQDATEIPALLDAMLALGARRYDPAVFEKYWRELAESIGAEKI